MARKLRIEFSGACYHVTNRGNYQRALFKLAGAAESFCACLDETCLSFGWRVHAFTVMGNHFHLAVETPEPNLSEGMKWLQGTWAQRFNRFRGLTGRPFQGRFKAKHVEPGHVLAQVAHYIHLNPLRAKLVRRECMADYRWSSLAWFPRRDRPVWLEPAALLHDCGGLADTPAGWRSYRRYLVLLAESNPKSRDAQYKELTRAWAVGSTAFRAELRAKLQDVQSGRFLLRGADREALHQARAECWENQLRALAVAFKIRLDRMPRKKSAVEKLILASAMKRTTSVSKTWLAQRLQMGAPNSLGPLLHRFRNSGTMERASFKSILHRFLT
jgi:putative transposase